MKAQEKGQIIVILAISLVAVLGITALAVDGGMIYKDRREDQTTADSASLSAAQTASSSSTCSTARTAAINQAVTYASVQEGVTLANNSTSPNRVEATCSGDNKTLTIKVVVTSITPTTFAKMISRNQLQTTVEATTKITFGIGAFAGGHGIVTLSTNCGVQGGFDPASKPINIIGAGLFSNSCITGSGPVTVTGGVITYRDTDTSSNFTPAPVKSTAPSMLVSIPPPDCSGLPNRGSSSSGGTILPGNYSKITAPSNPPLVLSPGLYCINSTSLNAFDVNAGANVTATGVTIYIKSGNFNIGTNPTLKMEAPNCKINPSPAGVPPAICGLLIYMDEPPATPGTKSDQKMTLTGVSGSIFSGTIFVPYGTVDVAGSGVTQTYKTQIIGYRVIATGSGMINLDLTDGTTYTQASSPTVELIK